MKLFKLEAQNAIVIGWGLLIFLLMLILKDGTVKTAIGVGGFALFIAAWPVLVTLAHKKKKPSLKKSPIDIVGSKQDKSVIGFVSDWQNLLLIATTTLLPSVVYSVVFNVHFGIALGIGLITFVATAVKGYVDLLK